ncbi:MAG: universal stress protein [Rhodobacteraceae bacterium]|jgi:nucleotide-binding universal stress UspA family protein|nr:universal stress protein [Paracoccaceae bacterium]MBL4559055.1 universal stress protein [Paracoccaceae bacterium]
MFKTLLLPVDLSAEASWKHALPAALKLCNPDSVLHVVTVVPDFGLSVVGSYFEQGFEERALKEVGRKLTDWVAAHIPDWVDVHPHVLHGRVYDRLLEAAGRLGVDTIVMASHTPALADYLLGPNAARVVRHASCSVLVVRAGGA